MVVAVGIDPGTKSFDLSILENGELIEAKSYSSDVVAKGGYQEIIKTIKGYRPDIVVGPSGYGTPVVCNEDIVDPRIFAEKVLLLSGYEGSAINDGVHGSEVYVGVVKLVDALWKSGLNTCYMPGVIHLTTVPVYRKINKIDMGTVDKLAAAFYVVYRLSEVESYETIDLIVAELGYGYNAVMSVDGGRIVDGHGGTLVSTSLLSIGGLDAEIPSLLGSWSRELNYSGGVLSACGDTDLGGWFRSEDDKCKAAFKAMVESLVKNILALKRGSDKRIYLTGRLSRKRELLDEIGAYGITPNLLPLSVMIKEAAIGYSLLGEGLANGRASPLFKHMKIGDACGGTLDWVIHPAFNKVQRAFHGAVRASLKRDAWYKFSCEG